MTSYEIIDAICDSINPILALIALALIIRFAIQKKYKATAIGMCFFMMCIVIVYGTMIVDNTIGVWPAFNADYSTHSAVCIALCISIYLSTRFWMPQLIVLFIYACLMLIQKYHSILDMISTALFVGLPLILLCLFLQKKMLER